VNRVQGENVSNFRNYSAAGPHSHNIFEEKYLRYMWKVNCAFNWIQGLFVSLSCIWKFPKYFRYKTIPFSKWWRLGYVHSIVSFRYFYFCTANTGEPTLGKLKPRIMTSVASIHAILIM